jgi:hypothetical protein
MTKLLLQGEPHELTFNMGFLRLMNKEYGIDPLNIGELSGDAYFALVYAIIFCGIATTCKQRKIETPSKEDVENEIDQLHPNAVSEFVVAFSNWMKTPDEIQDKTATKEGAKASEPFQVY